MLLDFSRKKTLLSDNLVWILNSFFFFLVLQVLCLNVFLRFLWFYQKLNQLYIYFNL